MRTSFNTSGIIGKPSDPSIAGTLALIYDYLTGAGYRVIIAADSAEFIRGKDAVAVAMEQIGRHCDLVIAVGGDGTFLAAARAIVDYGIPLIGVNLGRVGFLVDISPD